MRPAPETPPRETCVLILEEFPGVWYNISTFQRNEVSPTEKKGIKIAAQNRKAHHDYFVEDRYEAGIELFGTLLMKTLMPNTL